MIKACKQNTDGFVNKYCLEQDSLQILNLLEPQYNILHWLALLLKNRTFRLYNEIAIDARNYIIENFSINLADYDIVIGYRADDSYFSFAEAFVQNGLSLRSLNQALRLGKLGKQTALVSKKAFEHLTFEGSVPADKLIYYPKFITRDSKAREIYKKEIQGRRSYRNDIFILDILREELKNDACILYSYLFNPDTRINLSAEIPLLFQVCPEPNLQGLFCLPFIRSALFRKNLFPWNVPLFTGQAGHWQNINGVQANGLKIFFPEFPFQKLFPCILYKILVLNHKITAFFI